MIDVTIDDDALSMLKQTIDDRMEYKNKHNILQIHMVICLVVDILLVVDLLVTECMEKLKNIHLRQMLILQL